MSLGKSILLLWGDTAWNASLFPSGDHAGLPSCVGLVARFLAPVPSAFTTKISRRPTRVSTPVKAILPLWLDEAGLVGPVPAGCVPQLVSIAKKAIEATSSAILALTSRANPKKTHLITIFFSFPEDVGLVNPSAQYNATIVPRV